MDQVLKRTTTDKWHGLGTNLDPHDLPPGAARVQKNLRLTVPGELGVRKGIRGLDGSNLTEGVEDFSTDNQIIELYDYQVPTNGMLVYQLRSGEIKVLRDAEIGS